jgi:hypothetical protein
MKLLQTKLIKSIFKSDLLIFKQDITNTNISQFNKIIISIKQLIKIIELNKKLPLFLICQNKQYSMLIKKYLCFNSPKVSNVFLITYKTAVTLKTPAIYLLIDCENSGLFCSKIYQQSNSLIFSIEKTHLNQNYLGEYILDLNIICVKQILFILTIIKKIKSTYENIQKI